MTIVDKQHRLEEALGEMEQSILPGISLMLTGLLEAAENARPGTDAQKHAIELRMLALQLQTVTKQMDALSSDDWREKAQPARPRSWPAITSA